MNDKIVKEIDLDFYNNKIVSVDAKQYDVNARYILIACRNQGGACVLNKNIHKAYVRYIKPDESIVFNSCEITEDGKVLVELTQQMLAAPGSCAADLLIAGRDKELQNTSTMQFFVNVLPAPYPSEEVESSDEYTALQDLMDKALSDYESVKENAQKSADSAAASAENAAASKNNAAASAICAAEAAADSADSAAGSAQSAAAAAASASNAKNSENHADASASAASGSALTAAKKAAESSDSAVKSESYAHGGTNTREGEDTDNGRYYKNEAFASASQAAASERNAADSAGESETWSGISKSYAVGTSGEVRENDASDNARYYYEQSLRISQAFSGALLAKGTIPFAELDAAAKSTGYMYNISDTFVSDKRFADGGGIYYGAGSNVYYTADGMWDVLAASVVSGVKGEADNEYKQGLVNITKDSIGLKNVDNTADANKNVKYAAGAGSAAAAEKLTVSAGSSEQPIYFKDGKPAACTLKFAVLSQAAYDGLTAKDSHTVYFITP